ncbi:MAG: hypothetical protein U0232_14970 [Thermomicrobiales bacterium]
MSATTMVWDGKRAATRTVGQQGDGAGADAMATALVTTEREVRVPVRCGERRVIHGTWVKTPEGLRLRWVTGK